MAKTKKAAPATEEGFRLEFTPIDTIVGWPKNPKKHDEPGIEASIKRFGFRNALTFDERSQRLVAGHGRLEVLQRMMAAGEPPPQNIRVEGGVWCVPVIRGVAFENDAEAEAFIIADNRLTEAGGWNEESLNEMLKSIRSAIGDDVVVTGFSRADIDHMLDATKSTDIPPPASGAPSMTLQFSTEATRDAVKSRIGSEAGDKETAGDVLARILGVAPKARRKK